ncbi:MMS19 nucleotide excision repair [Melia azedarach]|uniref:MMS19 nucleotide excision repair n=1 Tax=Melia azedarach TaxID=155640 RepID=A0ACC1Y3M6_MELAZ|nr:MMS19 nucleotide excision repair [Melia azedarach]
MAESSQLTQHIESFVNLSTSPAHQAASLDAIVSSSTNNALTVETLVREMGMYLTTTDDVIRARGILLLGELLTRLDSKPLDDATVHSLIAFFTDRLADWKALRGALVGCLALVRRKSSGGVVTANDAKAVVQSYIQNLQVQSLAQHDRKLCFELLECLLQRYPDAVASLGEDLLYGICEAIDGEKDPHCLMLTFRIIEVVARLFPDDLLGNFAGDLFEILGCYFPIHFTHPTGEDFDVRRRDDLSRALMVAISSTPLFEPFAIPLLLGKLSSSLQSAKVDFLKYLSN